MNVPGSLQLRCNSHFFSFATLLESVAKRPSGQGRNQMEYAPGEASSCPTGASDGHSRGNAS